MANNLTLVLDTTGPQGVAASINSGAAYATSRDVSIAITTTDPDTTGYTVKIWGNVDPAADANIQTTEGASSWITLSPSISVRLSTGDAAKTLTVRLRDDVWNESSTASDSITLDTTAPVVSITSGPDVSKVSKISGKNTATFIWSSDSDFQAYKVKVVPATGSDNTAGAQIPTSAGSSNVSGASGTAGQSITTVIKGTDLEAASAGDGTKILKVFVEDAVGNWSV